MNLAWLFGGNPTFRGFVFGSSHTMPCEFQKEALTEVHMLYVDNEKKIIFNICRIFANIKYKLEVEII